MAATAGPADAAELIDIYSEEEFGQRNAEDGDLVGRTEPSDLYDDVLTGSVNHDRLSGREPALPSKVEATKSESKPAILYTYSGGRSKRLAVYVGNFSWWTTDTDLMNLALGIGVKDIEEIKFAENRANGQSRGYAEVVVSSEASLQRLLDTLPQCHLDGEKVDCRFATRQNFSVFESLAKKRVPQRSSSRESSDFGDGRPPGSLPDHQHSSVPNMHPAHLSSSKPPSLPVSFYPRPPPYCPDLSSPFLQPPPHVPPPPLPHMYPPPAQHMPNHPAPSLHLNPAFFPPSQEPYANPGYSHSTERDASSTPVPEGEFEEVMNRNRAIASSAITKAVSGATAGDFPLAIETLLTAIAVIKQSRVSGDECCRALVTSLKDCLFSIESKSYGSRKRHRSRDRERDRDKDRDRERARDKERNREREGSQSQAWETGGASRRHRERVLSVERERVRDRHREQRDHYR